MMGDDHTQFDVQTDDPFWIARLDKVATAYRVNGEGRWYKLRADQVVVRIGISDAKREASRIAGQRGIAARMAK
jgi:hypothetical protein